MPQAIGLYHEVIQVSTVARLFVLINAHNRVFSLRAGSPFSPHTEQFWQKHEEAAPRLRSLERLETITWNETNPFRYI